jgi:hypothetical protein
VQDVNVHHTVLTFFGGCINAAYCRSQNGCYINPILVMMMVKFGMRHTGRWLHSVGCIQYVVQCVHFSSFSNYI